LLLSPFSFRVKAWPPGIPFLSPLFFFPVGNADRVGPGDSENRRGFFPFFLPLAGCAQRGKLQNPFFFSLFFFCRRLKRGCCFPSLSCYFSYKTSARAPVSSLSSLWISKREIEEPITRSPPLSREEERMLFPPPPAQDRG